MSVTRTPTSRGAVDRHTGRENPRRPITRSATRVSAVIRGSQRARNGLIPLIEIGTDSGED